jgi:serine phosphatase RsbU (regulator of sigma subunit)
MADCRLHSGDTLVLYTDGITESCDRAGEEFGEKRVIESLTRHRNNSAAALVDAIVGDVKNFCPDEQSDDITLIVANCK